MNTLFGGTRDIRMPGEPYRGGLMPFTAYRPAIVVVENDGESPAETAFELLAAARDLPVSEVVAVVLAGDEAQGRTVGGTLPATEARIVTGPALSPPTADRAAAAVHEVAAERDAGLILLPHTPFGWDAAPLLAARCGVAAATGCTSVHLSLGGLYARRKAFLGKFVQEVNLTGRPLVATLEPGAVSPLEPGPPEAVRVSESPADPESLLSRLLEVRAAPDSGADLPAARVVVAAGRGLGGPENLGLVEDLAAALGGVVGASRAVTDAGWLPHDRQVGSSGVTVNPKLYVACGISGAIQHLVGMRGSGFVVAINRDPEAPIFGAADVGIVGDVLEILPALTRAIRAAAGA